MPDNPITSQLWRENGAKLILVVAVAHLCLACARKPPPPTPVFPPTSPDTIQQLRYPPSVPFDILEVVTIEAETGNQYEIALQEARRGAAAKGANAMVLVADRQFRQKIDRLDRTVRRTVFRVVRLKT